MFKGRSFVTHAVAAIYLFRIPSRSKRLFYTPESLTQHLSNSRLPFIAMANSYIHQSVEMIKSALSASRDLRCENRHQFTPIKPNGNIYIKQNRIWVNERQFSFSNTNNKIQNRIHHVIFIVYDDDSDAMRGQLYHTQRCARWLVPGRIWICEFIVHNSRR